MESSSDGDLHPRQSVGVIRHTPDSLTEDFLFEEINTDTSKQLGTWLLKNRLALEKQVEID